MNVQENEQFALAWLRAAYEPTSVVAGGGAGGAGAGGAGGGVEAGDVYRQYLSCCTKLARKGLIAPAHFPRLVRSVTHSFANSY